MLCVCLWGMQHEQHCKGQDAPSTAVRSLVSGASVMLTARDRGKPTINTEPNWSGALGSTRRGWEDPGACRSGW